MKFSNKVFIATSLDGYIADKDGSIDWLHNIPNPEGDDMGYKAFMSQVDSLVMGRTTFETVLAFGIDWPYEKPVFVLSNTMTKIPEELHGKVFLAKGPLKEILRSIHQQGYHHLYIDGGATIQGFLQEDLIDEMIITVIPTLLGGGSALFSKLDKNLDFECVSSKIYLNKIVQNHFKRLN